MHRLLQRQIRRALGADFQAEGSLAAFIGAIDSYYQDIDSDRALLENALEVNSRELTALNQRIRDQSEKDLELQQLLLQTVIDSVPDLVFFKDLQGKYLGCNQAFEKYFGACRADILGKSDHDFVDAQTADFFRQKDHEMLAKNQPVVNEEWVVYPDGQRRCLETLKTPYYSPEQKLLGLIGISRDITERKESEKAQLRLNKALSTIKACNEALVRATTEKQLLFDICRILVGQGGYRLAVVGFIGNEPDKPIVPVAQAGFDEGFVAAQKHTWAATERGFGPSGLAVRSGKIALCRDTQKDIMFAPWREEAAKRGFFSMISLPLAKTASPVFAVLDIYSAQADAFDEQEIRLLTELADDLAYGIMALRTVSDRDRIALAFSRHEAILLKSLEDSIRVIATTIEMRDPYTAGHQQRVAKLAVAMASHLGMNEDRIHGLRLAAIIHDLGKIAVPSELLSKPGAITAIELDLIRTHPQTGFEIIRDVDFPWPIAQMVHQHHERLDGSGYPQGLRGDEILPEAQILAVADVVEAMISHRPYRPALGIEPALAEIQKNSGRLYSKAVVDACLDLFKNQSFRFAD